MTPDRQLPHRTRQQRLRQPETTPADANATQSGDAADELSGTITMSGSTSMEKFANALAEAFNQAHPNVTITPEFTGSSAGIEAVLADTVDIGNSSRNLKDEEKTSGAEENIVAIDGIAVVVDPANAVTGLTKQQLSDVYTGTVTNGKDVGGADQPIVVVGREAGCGSRGIEEKCAYSNELDSTGAVVAKVASTPGAIGYISLDVLDDKVKAVALEGVEPTVETIKDGSYFLSRPFVMATKGAIADQSPLVQSLFEYLKSEEGKALVESVGLISVD